MTASMWKLGISVYYLNEMAWNISEMAMRLNEMVYLSMQRGWRLWRLAGQPANEMASAAGLSWPINSS
jgi:hypothetical protein